MTRLHELLSDEESIFVFDVDGVLAKMEFGDNKHYYNDGSDADSDIQFTRALLRGHDFYNDDLVNKTLQSFMAKRDNKKMYVLSRCFTKEEQDLKDDYLIRNYNVIKDNIMYVDDYKEKLEALNLVKKLNPDTDDEHIIMVDDNVDQVLNYIMENSNYTPMHISSFM